MVIQLGNATIDIDIKKTIDFYQSSRILTDGCSCEGCLNFISGVKKLGSDILDLFSKLGIDILKPTEMVAWRAEDNGKSVYYGGFYHICGRMLSDTDCWSSNTDHKGEICSSINEINLLSVTDDFSIGFTNTINLKENDFPEPVIQMEIFIHHFPWVLNTPNKF